jgi:hypothetical protein
MTTIATQNIHKQTTPPTSLVPPIVRPRAVSSGNVTADKVDKVKKRSITLEPPEGRKRASSEGRKYSSSDRRAKVRAELLGLPWSKTPTEKKVRSPEEIEARKKADEEGRKYLSKEKREALINSLLVRPLPNNIQILSSQAGS